MRQVYLASLKLLHKVVSELWQWLSYPPAQNPRWQLHHVTCIHHYTCETGESWDQFTWSVWSCCVKSSQSYGNGWVWNFAQDGHHTCGLHMPLHSCTSRSTTQVYLQSLKFLCKVISEPGCAWVTPGTKSKMATALCDLHTPLHSCTCRTMRQVYLASLKSLHEVISELWQWLSYPSRNIKSMAPCDLHILFHWWKWRVMSQVYLVSLKLPHEVISKLWQWLSIEFSPRWLPHCVTHMLFHSYVCRTMTQVYLVSLKFLHEVVCIVELASQPFAGRGLLNHAQKMKVA